MVHYIHNAVNLLGNKFDPLSVIAPPRVPVDVVKRSQSIATMPLFNARRISRNIESYMNPCPVNKKVGSCGNLKYDSQRRDVPQVRSGNLSEHHRTSISMSNLDGVQIPFHETVDDLHELVHNIKIDEESKNRGVVIGDHAILLSSKRNGEYPNSFARSGYS
jgi:hypothetical protein